MTNNAKIFQLWPPADERYPRVNLLHPRNRTIDWSRVWDEAENAPSGATLPYDVFVRERRNESMHVAWLSSSSFPALSSELKTALDEALGSSANYVAIRVNGRIYWIMREASRPDAIDLERSKLRHFDGGDYRIEKPAWRLSVVTQLGVFRVPGSGGIWVTERVHDAYIASGLNGLHFQEWGDVV